MTALMLPAATTGGNVLPFSLTEAARRAADTDPREVLGAWLGRVCPGTRKLYERSLRRFAGWALGDGHEPTDALRLLSQSDVGRAHSLVEGFRDSLVEAGLAAGTVNSTLAAIASACRVLRRLGLVGWKLERIGVRHEDREDRSGPTEAEVDRILRVVDAAAEQGDVAAVRDAAILRLAFCVGLRRNEIATLELGNVDLQAGTVKVKAKGRRELVSVALPPGVVQRLQEWLQHRGAEPGPMFARLDRARPTGRLEPLGGHSINALSKKWAKRAGIRRTVRVHGLRHSGASALVGAGVTGPALMSWGRWASMSACSRYVDRRDLDQRRLAALLDR